MDADAVIKNMKHKIETKDFPSNIIEIIRHKENHRRIMELALALGEERFLKYASLLSIDKDFNFDWEYGCCIRSYSSVSSSDFFRAIYEEIVGKDECMADIIIYGNVNVYIDLTHSLIPGKYRHMMYIPQISFSTPERVIKITEGVINSTYQDEYKELKVEAI